jgi:hypothetical protein
MSSPPSLPVPAHYAFTFKYFLPVCVRTLQAEQIKNTKTILRAYISDTEGVYRRLITTKNCDKDIKHRDFL